MKLRSLKKAEQNARARLLRKRNALKKAEIALTKAEMDVGRKTQRTDMMYGLKKARAEVFGSFSSSDDRDDIHADDQDKLSKKQKPKRTNCYKKIKKLNV